MAKGAATVWTTVKATSAASRAAKKGYGATRTARAVARPVVKILALPTAAAGATIIWRKTHGSSDDTGAEATRPLGPVSTADAVSPPATNADTAPTEAHAN